MDESMTNKEEFGGYPLGTETIKQSYGKFFDYLNNWKNKKFDLQTLQTISNLAYLNNLLSYSAGRTISNIMGDLGKSFNSKLKDITKRNYGNLMDDLKDFEDHYEILNNQKKLITEIINTAKEDEDSISRKDIERLMEFEGIRRDLQTDYTQRWIFYNKLFGDDNLNKT